MKPILEIDGERFDDLEGFWDEVSRVLVPNAYWGRNLDAFNDILRGGFGTPEGGFVLRWKHSARSRRTLGHEATVRWIERKLERCHPSNLDHVRADLEAARAQQGATIFDLLVDIIEAHGVGGAEPDDGVELRLE
jgi:RNAse (barnase) inhibitor barstar